MPELQFKVNAVQPGVATSSVCLRMEIANALPEEQIHSIALTVQLQIEPARRRYTPEEQAALADIFGGVERWSRTVRPLFWTVVKAVVPAFTGITEFDLLVPRITDCDVAADRYLHALRSGEVPVVLLFSGRVLYVAGDSLQMAPIPWSHEAVCRIPLHICKEASMAVSPHDGGARGTTWT